MSVADPADAPPPDPARGECTPTAPVPVGGTPLRFKGVAGESRMRPRLVPEGTTTRYYQKLRNDDFIAEFVVLNPVGPQRVFTLDPATGDQLCWGCRHTGPDEITFYPHPAYRGGPVCYVHGPECRAEPMYAQPTTLYSFGDAHGQRPGGTGGGGPGPAPGPAVGPG